MDITVLFIVSPRTLAMAEEVVPDLNSSRDEDAESQYEERGIDTEGLEEGDKPTPLREFTPDTISQFSQMSNDEPDGKSTGKKKKKYKIIRDGKECEMIVE